MLPGTSPPLLVLVHGAPETAAVWAAVTRELTALGRDRILTLAPPGFGAPMPSGFVATMTGYRDWLVSELDRLGEPVDLVGHDWGGIHVLNALAARPDLARRWVSDAAGVLHPRYEWHELARRWQGPHTGEQAVEALLSGTPQERAAGLRARGMHSPAADDVAAQQDQVMGIAILSLYRSAVQPALVHAGAAVMGATLPAGLVLSPEGDTVTGDATTRREVADAVGADFRALPGLGHWWMTEDPALGAKVLDDFFGSPDPPAALTHVQLRRNCDPSA